jgi:hypothetical protein
MLTQKILKNIHYQGNKSKHSTLIGTKLWCFVNFDDEMYSPIEFEALIEDAIWTRGHDVTLWVGSSRQWTEKQFVEKNSAMILKALDFNYVFPALESASDKALKDVLTALNRSISHRLSAFEFEIPKSKGARVPPQFKIQLWSSYVEELGSSLLNLNDRATADALIDVMLQQQVDFICAPGALDLILKEFMQQYEVSRLNLNEPAIKSYPEILKLRFDYEKVIYIADLERTMSPREIAAKVHQLPEPSQWDAFQAILMSIQDFETLKLIFKYLKVALQKRALEDMTDQIIDVMQSPEHLRSLCGIMPIENRSAFFSQVSHKKPNLINNLSQNFAPH